MSVVVETRCNKTKTKSAEFLSRAVSRRGRRGLEDYTTAGGLDEFLGEQFEHQVGEVTRPAYPRSVVVRTGQAQPVCHSLVACRTHARAHRRTRLTHTVHTDASRTPPTDAASAC